MLIIHVLLVAWGAYVDPKWPFGPFSKNWIRSSTYLPLLLIVVGYLVFFSREDCIHDIEPTSNNGDELGRFRTHCWDCVFYRSVCTSASVLQLCPQSWKVSRRLLGSSIFRATNLQCFWGSTRLSESSKILINTFSTSQQAPCSSSYLDIVIQSWSQYDSRCQSRSSMRQSAYDVFSGEVAREAGPCILPSPLKPSLSIDVSFRLPCGTQFRSFHNLT